ncbi:MAG: winged helix-turn-helix transcriptional regulator, partial [Moorea sp. SIO2B7]|nr:winged helix-turn-helix transcriptional regulator [Moorena sp. SIO2B7]
LDQYTLSADGEPIELTPTEFNLLKVLMESPGHTFSREELLEKALGYGYEGFGRTLDTQIRVNYPFDDGESGKR